MAEGVLRALEGLRAYARTMGIAVATEKAEAFLRDGMVPSAIAAWVDALLTLSVAAEEILVERGFPLADLERLLQLLDEPRALLSAQSGVRGGLQWQQLATALNTDHVEMLLWRRGSAAYAAAATHLAQQPPKESEDPQAHIARVLGERPGMVEALSNGSNDLGLLLKVAASRSGEAAGQQNSDTQLEELLARGLRSDVHVLALAYRAELALWRACAVHPTADEEWLAVARKVGQRYLHVVEKLLPHGAGWQTERIAGIVADVDRITNRAHSC